METFIQIFLSNSNNKKIQCFLLEQKWNNVGTKWNKAKKFFGIFLMDKTIYYIYDATLSTFVSSMVNSSPDQDFSKILITSSALFHIYSMV